MKKSYWKNRARAAERLIQRANRGAEVATDRVVQLREDVAELTRELEDKRKNWAPIKIKHPYVPRDAGCMYCDDPREDPRHEPEPTAQTKELRPDTGDGQSLPCARCGVKTPDASFVGGMPLCDNCAELRESEDSE